MAWHAEKMPRAIETFRDEFVLEPDGPVYLDGNSLGRLPKGAQRLAAELVSKQWGERLIRGWNDGWYDLPRRLGAKIGQIIGARPGEVVVCDSTSVNLFKLTTAVLRARAPRNEIVTSERNFPSDLYVLDGVGRVRHGEANSSTAVVALTQTDFRTAETIDLVESTGDSHAAGAWALWDLSHSAGAVPIDMTASRAELAVGCTYKYLNGGPGAPAYLYVRREVQALVRSPIQGWFGHGDPFAFSTEYEPAPGAARFLAGTPPVISMALMEPGLDLILEAGMTNIRARSIELTAQLIEQADALGVEVATPRDAARRGSHVSLRHEEAWRITRALIEEHNVIPDFRGPDLIRFGVAPLYNNESDIDLAMASLDHVLATRTYENYPFARLAVP